jgi:predicted component of type VI protein secretion system
MAVAIEVLRTDTGEHETFTCAASPVRIGRSPLNNVVLAAPWVSLHHGLIHFDDQQASYSDLGSTNGTSAVVNEQEMKLQPMVPMQILGGGHDDGELRIGVITLRVRWDAVRPVERGGKRNFETRLTASKIDVAELVGSDPSYPRSSTPADPGRGTGVSSAAGRAPLYQAGHTRMVMPGDPHPSVGGEFPPPERSPAPAPTPDALGRMSMTWGGSAAGALELHGREKAFAETLAAVADAFARGLVELKKGLKEFGEGIGVRAVGGHSPLHRAQTAKEVLDYLLDQHGDTRERLEQLVDLFADLMIHEVALLSGVKAGVRQLLTELDPEQGYAESEKGGRGLGLLDRSLRRYREYFKSATEDDGQSSVFGTEFARAYADALGTALNPDRPPNRRR